MEKLTNEKELLAVIDQIKDRRLNNFLKYIFDTYHLGNDFFCAPGATTKNHHSYPGGLAYHTVHAAELGAKIADHYLSLGFTLDKDLVIAGILLHDIGKIMAYEVKGRDENGVYQIDKTPHERLYHHIPTGVLLIDRSINLYNDDDLSEEDNITQEQRDKLLHIILSHHGRKAWASPVIPQFLEAYIVHIVEFMDGMIEKYADGKIPDNIYDH